MKFLFLLLCTFVIYDVYYCKPTPSGLRDAYYRQSRTDAPERRKRDADNQNAVTDLVNKPIRVSAPMRIG
ncbi:hypothetical protein JTE90_027361 [Oedothorax gibbosus]|uniref:Uncharacterized protein n=1 Tax=Oedothorax gibbosus TaxID=931172 RepID=A0AAV6VXZ4_9ARAC|nr:hypothetical protein JTE90_027361 [Oedothorax gibbosus]